MCVVISAMVFVNHYLAFDFFSSVWYPFSEVQFLFVAFLCLLFLLEAEMLVDTHESLYPYNFPLVGYTEEKKGFLLGSEGGACHQCGPGLNPCIDAIIHELSLLLVLSLA